jgi:hypothetical protein
VISRDRDPKYLPECRNMHRIIIVQGYVVAV